MKKQNFCTIFRFDEILIKPEDLRKDILLFRNGKVLRKYLSHLHFFVTDIKIFSYSAASTIIHDYR